MAVAPSVDGEKGGCGSQFYITLADNIEYLDGKHAVFGHVVEGLETLDKVNDVFTDQEGRPFKDVRIRHVVILGRRLEGVCHSILMLLRRPISGSRGTHSATLFAYPTTG